MAFKTQGEIRSNKEKKPLEDNKTFTSKEVEFIAGKLRQADYKGTEFEIFYNIMKKLAEYSK